MSSSKKERGTYMDAPRMSNKPDPRRWNIQLRNRHQNVFILANRFYQERGHHRAEKLVCLPRCFLGVFRLGNS